jgi:SAM-dependent MidA family methyltransferase
MPCRCKLLHFDGTAWFERGVAVADDVLAWADRPTGLRPPVDAPFVPGTVTEIHPQAEAFVRTLAERLGRGRPSSSTTASRSMSTTTRSATAAR